jgi:alkylhydroperoxidase/carboxymuconolactone decarboxylase family protein YurZ
MRVIGIRPLNLGDAVMTSGSKPAPNPFADIAPALGEYTQKVLFGDVWERSGLSRRDRSLITVASLVSLYRTNELPFHLKRALENGVTKDELIELPADTSAMSVSRTAWRSMVNSSSLPRFICTAVPHPCGAICPI